MWGLQQTTQVLGRSEMYIKKIEIREYRHLKDITLGPFRPPTEISDLIVLAGPNGGGKTSILELVSLALSNTWSLTYSINRTAPSSSFEVTLGLIPGEVALLESHMSDELSDKDKEAHAYLTRTREYCRSFNFAGGEYDKDPPLHNWIHNLVQQTLRGTMSRPMGFYLGADRSYQKKDFQNKLLFNYSQYSTSQHAWSFAFQSPSAQYEDMYNYLIIWRYHFTRRLGQYLLDLEAGSASESDRPVDEYGAILSRVFPGYRFVESEGDSPADLYVQLPSGTKIPFSELSSGEKEVFFLLSFYQRHDVNEAVIIIDEPELHLHPSLARVLLKTMQELKPFNQVWLATQSSEVIDHAGRDKVFFVRRNDQNLAEVVASTDEDEALLCLRDFFGYSGYVGLARSMVFTEGRNASADRKTFSMITQIANQEVKFIPSGSCSELERLNRAVLSIIESEVGWCKFYLIRDRDYLDEESLKAKREKCSDRMFILDKHELENYLLNFQVISNVLTQIYDQDVSAMQVEEVFRQCAIEMSGDVLRELVSYRLNMKFQSEDFSVPKLFSGQLSFREGAWGQQILGQLENQLGARCTQISSDLGQRINSIEFSREFEAGKREVETAINADSWVDLFPGKELLNSFSKKRGLPSSPALQNLIIKEMARDINDCPKELREILDIVST